MATSSEERPLRLLIVDDSSTVRRMIISALRSLKPEVCEAASGLEAIERLSLCPVDGITLDLNMPDMHGLEFLRFVRSHHRFEKLPVVVVSTRSDDRIIHELMEAGANQYVTKPFKPEEVLQAIQTALDLS